MSGAMITADQFRTATKRDPRDDEIDRCNCTYAGQVGHRLCGWCTACTGPVFLCLHRVRKA